MKKRNKTYNALSGLSANVIAENVKVRVKTKTDTLFRHIHANTYFDTDDLDHLFLVIIREQCNEL